MLKQAILQNKANLCNDPDLRQKMSQLRNLLLADNRMEAVPFIPHSVRIVHLQVWTPAHRLHFKELLSLFGSCQPSR